MPSGSIYPAGGYWSQPKKGPDKADHDGDIGDMVRNFCDKVALRLRGLGLGSKVCLRGLRVITLSFFLTGMSI